MQYNINSQNNQTFYNFFVQFFVYCFRSVFSDFTRKYNKICYRYIVVVVGAVEKLKQLFIA